MTRIILNTGKGGVGKTSVAAATALLCAERGYNTLIMSTDIAHSLADSFDLPLGAEPTQIAPRLWGQESDVFHNVQRHWGTIQAYMKTVFKWRGLDEIMSEELTVLPGMDELASLIWIAEHHAKGEYDVIIIDAAPTGETLRLLALPEAAKWWVEKIFPVQKRIVQLAGPAIRRMTGMPMPDQAVFRSGEELLRKLERMHGLLTDPEVTSVRLVVNLEKMVIKEAQRAFTYFHLYGYPTDLVVCNRVLPDDPGEYFAQWHKTQQRHWPLLNEAFAPVPVRPVPFFDHEVVGLDCLREVGAALFGDIDPTHHFYTGRPYTVRKENGGFVLSLELPFTTKEDVRLTRQADELVLQVGSFRRNLVLPHILLDLPTTGAKFSDETLNITFGPTTNGSAGG